MFKKWLSRGASPAEGAASRQVAKGRASLGPTGHVDTFARDNLPPDEAWPDLLLDRAEFQYPDYLNAGVELTDKMVERGFGDHTALIGNGRRRTYKELTDWSNRVAHALVQNYGLKPGNRVLIQSPHVCLNGRNRCRVGVVKRFGGKAGIYRRDREPTQRSERRYRGRAIRARPTG